MPSDINNAILSGHLLTDPVEQADGSVIVTLQNHEEWRDARNLPQSRENMIGLLALPGEMAQKLLTFRANQRAIIVAKIETRTTTGPRGGKETKTKLRICAISRPA